MTSSESARLEALRALNIMGSDPEPEFDRIARLAGHVANADYAQICFIDAEHQFIKAMDGGEGPRLTTIDDAICAEAVFQQAVLTIPDLANDSRRASRAVHAERGFKSYVGVPIRTPDGHVIGAIAALSFGELALLDRRIEAMEECAHLVGREVILRQASATAQKTTFRTGMVTASSEMLRLATANHLAVLRRVTDGVIVVRRDGSISFANPAAERMLGCVAEALLGRKFSEAVAEDPPSEIPGARDCAVELCLQDGVERLVRSAHFRRAEGSSLRVGLVVSPVSSSAGPVGAVVIFRPLDANEFSNGIDLRATLREVSRLKEQLARLQAAHRSASLAASPLPSLSSKTRIDLNSILKMIDDEKSDQDLRSRACGGMLLEDRRKTASPGCAADRDGDETADVKLNPSSRMARWLSSDSSTA